MRYIKGDKVWISPGFIPAVVDGIINQFWIGVWVGNGNDFLCFKEPYRIVSPIQLSKRSTDLFESTSGDQ